MFGTLNIDSDVYNSVGNGEYMRSDVVFGAAGNLIRLQPGKRANAKAPTSASVTRKFEKDFTDGTVVTRKGATVNLQVNVPDGFTVEEVDELISDISTLATPEFLTRLLLGES